MHTNPAIAQQIRLIPMFRIPAAEQSGRRIIRRIQRIGIRRLRRKNNYIIGSHSSKIHNRLPHHLHAVIRLIGNRIPRQQSRPRRLQPSQNHLRRYPRNLLHTDLFSPAPPLAAAARVQSLYCATIPAAPQSPPRSAPSPAYRKSPYPPPPSIPAPVASAPPQLTIHIVRYTNIMRQVILTLSLRPIMLEQAYAWKKTAPRGNSRRSHSRPPSRRKHDSRRVRHET
jgi:hypothetical protein